MRHRFPGILILMACIITLVVYFFAQVYILRQNAASAYQINLNRHFMEFINYADRDQKTSFLATIESLTASKDTRLLALSSKDHGIIELWVVNQDYLNYDSSNIGKIRFPHDPLFETVLGASSGNYTLSAVLRVLTYSELKQVFCVMLYLLVAYALLALFVICIIAIGNLFSSRNTVSGSKNTMSDGRNIKQRDIVKNAPAPRQTLDGEHIWPEELLGLRLNNEIERSAANEHDIGFVVFRLNKAFWKSNALLNLFEKKLLEVFRHSDMIYHIKPYYYGIIMPNREQEDCLKEITYFLHSFSDITLDTNAIFVGYSTRNGRLMNGDRLYKEGLRAATIATPNEKRLVYFKSDLKKYQSHLLASSEG